MAMTLCGWLRRAAIIAMLLVPGLAPAQDAAKPFTKEQLDQMLAQIALYPDSLLSQVLMASTYPVDVAAAAKWSREHSEEKGEEAVKKVANEDWDPSVQSLVAVPQVLITMGEKPDWVKDMGDAFLAQPEEVMDAVQRLRQQAQKAGNLKSNEQVKISTEPAPAPAATTTVVQQQAPPQTIIIEQAQPEVVYVPSYNPAVVYGAWPYPAYPPYYYPLAARLLVLGCRGRRRDRNRLGRRHRRRRRAVGWLQLGQPRRRHQRQPLQQRQREQEDRCEQQQMVAQHRQPQERRLSRRRSAAPESRPQGPVGTTQRLSRA